jgi:3-deoxy-manno-octulosonate cytidylyltransferase (CMP-KDO synthetase)
MIRHVWERAKEARVFDRVIVATDSPVIRDLVVSFGGEAAMTSPRIRSGTDRVAQVARRLKHPLIVNLQGDEPFISPGGLSRLVRAMGRDPGCPFGTIARLTRRDEIADNPNAVKVVTDGEGKAVYFSRAPIPYDAIDGDSPLLQHLGVYIYRRSFLLKFASWPRTALEKREKLEQLRALEYRIHPMVVVVRTPALSIDTHKDLKRAREWLRKRGGRPVAG